MFNKDYILLALENIKILAMSDKLTEARDAVKSASDEFVKHIIKRLIVEDSDNYNHWAGEISGFVKPLMKITVKPKAKKMPKNIMFQEFCKGNSYKNLKKTIREVSYAYGSRHRIRQFYVENTNELKALIDGILRETCDFYIKYKPKRDGVKDNNEFDIEKLKSYNKAVTEAESH